VDGRSIEVPLLPNEIATLRVTLSGTYRIGAPAESRRPSAPWLENLEVSDGNGAWVVVPSVRESVLDASPIDLDVDIANLVATAIGASMRVGSVRISASDAVAIYPRRSTASISHAGPFGR
jgi:hypothetical protein